MVPVFLMAQYSAAMSDLPESLRSWVTMDSQEQTVRHALHHYFNPESNLRLSVIPMAHVANKTFYQNVNDMIQGKTVIYESTCANWKELDNVFTNIAGIEDAQIREFSLGLFSADSYGKSTAFNHWAMQLNSILYSQANEAIHADWDSNSSFLPPVIKAGFTCKDSDELYRFILDSFGGEIEQHLDFAQREKNLVQENPVSFIEQILPKRADQVPGYKNIVLDRNEIMYGKINEVLSREERPEHIIVMYGAGHFEDFDSRMENLGFILQSTEWMDVISLDSCL